MIATYGANTEMFVTDKVITLPSSIKNGKQNKSKTKIVFSVMLFQKIFTESAIVG